MHTLYTRLRFMTPPRFVAIVAVIIMALGIVHSVTASRLATQGTVAAQVSVAPFPAIATDGLTSTQQHLLAVLKQEYALHPKGSDSAIRKYTEGYDEAWCADFISWVMNQADTPYSNPNSGSWRVPGVLTLQDMYIDAGGYREVGTYTPKLGDVAFYIGSQTPDGGSEGHVAIVLKVEGNMMTTIGGNEGDSGELKIRTSPIQEGDKGLVGFGISA